MTEQESEPHVPPPAMKRGDLWKRLTNREAEVAAYIALGRKNEEIAAHIGISVKTVGSHRAAALKKTNCRNNVELCRLAIHEGAVDVP